jgi:hypothetical protein
MNLIGPMMSISTAPLRFDMILEHRRLIDKCFMLVVGRLLGHLSWPNMENGPGKV